ncbi:uncharacterized protein LOC134273503 [Saccostrea cucullata]|uniref:uncharacterized protein LOC134273503 n=1 Tax=Saccostrea cuccullata TaxID=36930 RepID=UPI002ED1B25F
MTSRSEDRKTEVQHLQINTDLMTCICKMEDCKNGIDALKEKIRKSPYYVKYVEYLAKKNPPVMNVTGNWHEDIGIQAAAEIFNIKIYVNQILNRGENKITLFLPKDTDAERWLKISVDKESRYKYLSDCDTCNEEEAKLLEYDDVYEMYDQDSTNKEGNHLMKKCLSFVRKIWLFRFQVLR